MNWRLLATKPFFASVLMVSLALIEAPALAQQPKKAGYPKIFDPEPQKKWNEYILFHRKVFTDTSEFVHVIGGLTGEGYGLPNNAITIECFKSQRSCTVAQTGEFGSRQVDAIEIRHYDISVWEPSTITMVDISMCSTLNVTINRQTKDVTFVTTPGGYASTSALCQENADGKTYVWHLTDPLSAIKIDQAARQAR